MSTEQARGSYLSDGRWARLPLAVALVAQHAVVRPDDLSRVQLAFFTLNAAISVTLLTVVWLSLVLAR